MLLTGRSFKSEPMRGGGSAGLTMLVAVMAVGGGVYFLSQRVERKVGQDNIAQVAALARAEKETEWLQQATREQRAILGMTNREVLSAKGSPAVRQKAESLSDAERAKGGAEKWIYDVGGGNEATVLFGPTGLVIETSDVSSPPRLGQVIRQP